MKNVENKIWGADCSKVVMRVEASCAHARGSSMSMLMELSWASGGGVKRGGDLEFLRAQTRERGPPLAFASIFIVNVKF